MALTWGGDYRLEPVGSVELVQQIPAEVLGTRGMGSITAGAPSSEPPLYVEVESASALELPTLEEFLADLGVREDCANTPGNFIRVGVEYHTTGQLCLPGETGLAAWPDPCGGIATRPISGTLDTLLHAGRLDANGLFPYLMQLEVAGVESSACVDSFDDALTRAEITLGLGTDSRSAVATFRFEPGAPEDPPPFPRVSFDAMHGQGFCWEFDAALLTPFAEALIAHDVCTESGLEHLVEQGLAGGEVCLESAVVSDTGGVTSSAEFWFTLRFDHGKTLECGISEGFR